MSLPHSTNHRYTTWLIAFAAACWWSWIGSQSLWSAATDSRVLGAFFTDEVLQVDLVRSTLQRDSWNLNFGSYGHLVFNTALVLLRVIGPENPSDQQVTVVLRALSLFWAWATTVATFLLARRIVGQAGGVVAAALLALHPVQLRWSTLGHPDTAQACLIVVTILALASFERMPRPRPLLVAAAAAGLAFATKYLSITIVPIFLYVLFRRGGEDALRSRSAFNWRVVHLARAVIGTLGAASLLTGVLVDPLHIAQAVAEDGRVDFPGSERLSAITDWLLIAGGLLLTSFMLWSTPWRRLVLNTHASTVVRWSLAGAAAFVGAFLIVSPLSMYHLFIVKGLVLVFSYLLFGEGNSWAGLVIEAFGPAMPVLAIGIAVAVRALIRASGDEPPELGLSVIWVATCVLVLAFIRWPAEQYLLPIYPFVSALFVLGVQRLTRWMAAQQQSIDARWMAGAAYAAVLTVALVPFPEALHRWSHRLEYHPAIPLGQSMEGLFDERARVLYDHSTYVPAAFTNATPTWGATRHLLEEVAPDVVVVRHRTRQEMSVDEREYYECLVSESCGYRVALSNEFASVLERDAQ